VILTAEGIGIVSILPMALHLAARKSHDNSARKQFAAASQPDQPDTTAASQPGQPDTTAEANALTADRAVGSMFRDATRKVDLIWRLEHNDQEMWVAEQLKALQALDPENVSPMTSPAVRRG